MAQNFGVENKTLPSNQPVRTTDYNTIAVVGIAPKGQANTLVLCSTPSDDLQFGSAISGFDIPLALAQIRACGAGKIVVINVFDPTTMSTTITDEAITVAAQKTATLSHPIDATALVLKDNAATTTYVRNTDYRIDDYGNIVFMIAIADAVVVKATYKKLSASISTTVATAIIGSISGSTYKGLELLAMCKSKLQLVPKILICPGYNTLTSVSSAMAVKIERYRMRAILSASVGLTAANAVSSRAPGGSLATWATGSNRFILVDRVYAYDPRTASYILSDSSATAAGQLAANAAKYGPHDSPSNRAVPSIQGAQISQPEPYEDPDNTQPANTLRNAGIVSFFPKTGEGWIWWGVYNAAWPSDTGIASQIAPRYVADVLTDSLTELAIKYIDRNISNSNIASFLASASAFLKSKVTDGWIGGNSKIEYLKERNPDSEIQLGHATFTRSTYYYTAAGLITMEEQMLVQIPNIK
jgi:uncharacterized protein